MINNKVVIKWVLKWVKTSYGVMHNKVGTCNGLMGINLDTKMSNKVGQLLDYW